MSHPPARCRGGPSGPGALRGDGAATAGTQSRDKHVLAGSGHSSHLEGEGTALSWPLCPHGGATAPGHLVATGHCVPVAGPPPQHTSPPWATMSPWHGHLSRSPHHHGSPWPPCAHSMASSPGHLATMGHLVAMAWPPPQTTCHQHRAPSPRPHPHHCGRRGDRSWGTENRWANLLRATFGSTGAGKGTKPGGDSGDSGGGSGGCGGCSGGCGGSVPLQRLSKHQLWRLFALAA